MLAEERTTRILSILELEGSVTVARLMDILNASESTVRRDLNQMDKAGLLTKVHGGAILDRPRHQSTEENVNSRKLVNIEDKMAIAKYAASLVEPDDFVYIDAGTTTECMIDCLEQNQASYVTNAVGHAKKLSEKGFRVCLAGGELKSITDAIVGGACIEFLDRYHFTKGFFGVNGLTPKAGLTTPEPREGTVKKYVMKRCKDVYVLTDVSKFSTICSIKFGDFTDGQIITTKLKNKELLEYDNITEV